MGLDMYLYAERYKSTLNNSVKKLYPVELQAFGNDMKKRFVGTKAMRWLVGYWRGAWQINELLNDKLDVCNDCKEVYVDFETLEALADKCKDHPEWEQADYTIELIDQLKELIDKNPNWEFIYSASR